MARNTANRHRRASKVEPRTVTPVPGWVLLGVLPALLVLASFWLAVHPITDPDFWYHATFGREAVRTGGMPDTEIFTHTAAGHYWISSGWLPDVVLHLLYHSAGAIGPILLVFACVAMGVLAIYFAGLRLAKNGAYLAALLLVALLASYPRFNPRPDIFSQLLVVPLVLVLGAPERTIRDGTFARDRLLWLLPLLILVWANLHALFFIGISVVALYAAWRAWLWRSTRASQHVRALLPCALCGVAWLVNPYGWRILQFVYDNATLPDVARRVFELKPFLGADLFAGRIPLHLAVALLSLVALVAWTAWRGRTTMTPWRWVALVVFVFLAMVQRRQVGLAAMALPALILPALATPGTFASRRWFSLGAVGLLVFLIGAMRTVGLLDISRGLPRAGVDCAWFPCGAAAFLKENRPPDYLFHDLYTGGYLLHELGPETPVFIDGRLEIFKGEVWNDYFGPPDGRMTLDELFTKYGVNACVLDIRGAPGNAEHTANRLARRADWQLVYFDDTYAAFVQRNDDTANYLAQHGYTHVNPLNWEGLGQALQSIPNHAAALGEARRALEISPQSANAHAAMAMVYYNLGNRTDGDKHMKQAQQLDPRMAIGPAQ